MFKRWSATKEIADPFQVLESESGGIRGSAFRSLAEDGAATPSTAPTATHLTKQEDARQPQPRLVAPESPHLSEEKFELHVHEVEGSLGSLSSQSTDEGPSIGLSLKKSPVSDPWSYSHREASVDESFNQAVSEDQIEVHHRSPTPDQSSSPEMRKRDSILDAWGPPTVPQPLAAAHQSQMEAQFSSPMTSTASLISSQIFTSSKVKIKLGWLTSVASILTAVSAAVSLGNILRLPRLVLLHGGGPFLVAYLVLLVVIGLPLVFFEIGLGQFCQQGSLQIYRAVPLLKGVGIVKLIASLLMCAYYPVLMAVSFFSLIWSAKGPVLFAECAQKFGMHFYDHSEAVALQSENPILEAEKCLNDTILKSPQEDAMWLGVNYALLFLLWGLLTLSQWGYVAWQRRTMLLTVPVGFGLLIAILAQAASFSLDSWPLEWSDWSVLLKPQVWYFAMVQVFFSTQIGFGTNVTNAGKIFPKKNAFWVALSMIFFNIVAALGAVWVAWLWLKSSSVNPPSNLKSDLPEIVVLSLLIDYAGSIVDLGSSASASRLWAALGCAALLVAGFISTTSMLFTVITAISSETPAEKMRRWHIVAAVCAFGFVAGVLIFVPGQIVFVHLLDHYVIGRLIMATCILELVGFAWIYGCETLYNDFEFVLGQKMNKIWKIIWMASPLLLLAIELWSIFGLPLNGLPSNQSTIHPDPEWVTITGWTMYLSMWAIVLLSAIRTVSHQVDYNFTDKLRSSIKPSHKWGPADPLHRHGWVRWRTQFSTTGRKDFTLRRKGTRDYTHSARASPNTTLVRTPKKANGPSPLATSTPVAPEMPWQSNPSP
ncbi:sodium-dependent nutrient amino acid transporter 1-like [Cloeon dipterum]|uniref:sodium-dependent nutrient amino acid transporter 1-like n=1 Tax=Cloeon dipterum TaxID=197152 RepID=UPI0032206AD7